MTGPPTHADIESDALRARLRALASVLEPFALPAVLEASGSDEDLQQALTTLTDRLLERVAPLTASLRAREVPLDEIETTAARLLLADLSTVAGAWRALQVATLRRLDAAARELDEAVVILERALNTATV